MPASPASNSHARLVRSRRSARETSHSKNIRSSIKSGPDDSTPGSSTPFPVCSCACRGPDHAPGMTHAQGFSSVSSGAPRVANASPSGAGTEAASVPVVPDRPPAVNSPSGARRGERRTDPRQRRTAAPALRRLAGDRSACGVSAACERRYRVAGHPGAGRGCSRPRSTCRRSQQHVQFGQWFVQFRERRGASTARTAACQRELRRGLVVCVRDG